MNDPMQLDSVFDKIQVTSDVMIKISVELMTMNAAIWHFTNTSGMVRNVETSPRVNYHVYGSYQGVNSWSCGVIDWLACCTWPRSETLKYRAATI